MQAWSRRTRLTFAVVAHVAVVAAWVYLLVWRREDDFSAASRLVAEMGAHRSPLPDRMDAVERAYREIVRRPADASLVAEQNGQVVGIF